MSWRVCRRCACRTRSQHCRITPTWSGLIRFSVDDIIALAGAEHLHLDWDEDDEEEEEANAGPGEPERYVYSSEAETDEEDNPLAAALRKAMQDRAKE